MLCWSSARGSVTAAARAAAEEWGRIGLGFRSALVAFEVCVSERPMVSDLVPEYAISCRGVLTGRVEFEVFLQVSVSEVALYMSVRDDAGENW